MLLPRTIRGRVFLGLMVVIVVALSVVAIAVPSIELVNSLLAGAFIAGLLAIVLSYFVARAITRPIERFIDVAERDVATDVGDVRGPEEVQRLAGAMRRAAVSLRSQRSVAEAERERLATLIDELADAIFILDTDGRVELANAAARASAAGVVGRRVAEVVRDHEALEAIEAARTGHEQVATIERAEPRRFQRVVARPLGGGKVLVVVQDLTNLRRLETMRSDFVANVSHELRRPISSLKAMAETLEEGALDDRAAARDFVGRMHREIDGLAQLVNELLALTRLESRTESLTLERVAPAQLVRDGARRMGPLASRAGVALVVDTTRASDVTADAERIAQVLANLVHNAVKFTPSGGTIRIGAEDEDGQVVFHVSDTGVGIEAADLERVFERFHLVLDGAAFAASDLVAGFRDQLNAVPGILVTAAIWSLLLATVGLAIGAFTPRRAYATAAIGPVFLVGTALAALLRRAAESIGDRPTLLDVHSVAEGVRHALLGGEARGPGRGPAGGGGGGWPSKPAR